MLFILNFIDLTKGRL